jgi:hypothetical protein
MHAIDKQIVERQTTRIRLPFLEVSLSNMSLGRIPEYIFSASTSLHINYLKHKRLLQALRCASSYQNHRLSSLKHKQFKVGADRKRGIHRKGLGLKVF